MADPLPIIDTRTAVTIPIRTVSKMLLIVTLLLFCLHGAGIYFTHFRLVRSITGQKVIRFFDMNKEANVPTFFATVLLLLASLLLCAIYFQRRGQPGTRRDRRYWLGLGVLFVLLAMDENIQVHEWVTTLMKAVLARNFTGFLRYPWVVPYLAGTAVLALLLKNFFYRLPAFIRTQFVLAGAIYVSGAAGLEMVEAYLDSRLGAKNVYTTILCGVEEAMEMTGVIRFSHALLTYLALPGQSLRVAFFNH